MVRKSCQCCGEEKQSFVYQNHSGLVRLSNIHDGNEVPDDREEIHVSAKILPGKAKAILWVACVMHNDNLNGITQNV